MKQETNCDCTRLELLEEKLESCRESKQSTCENERTELKTILENTKKKLVMYQILCAVAFAILGKEGVSEAVNYFTSVESIQTTTGTEIKEVTINDENNNKNNGSDFRIETS